MLALVRSTAEDTRVAVGTRSAPCALGVRECVGGHESLAVAVVLVSCGHGL